MEARRLVAQRAALTGLAVAGLVAGHCLAFRAFAPAGPHAHHHHAGHSHAPYVLALIVGILVAAIGSFADSRSASTHRPLRTTAAVLFGLQVMGFMALSVSDRIAGRLGTEIGSRAFWFGIAIQLLVALLGTLLLAIFNRTADAIRRLLRVASPSHTQPATSESDPSFDVALPALAMATGGPTFRGPPLER